MIRNNRKGNRLSWDPHRPIFDQQAFILNILPVVFESFFHRIVIQECLDNVGGRKPHDGCADKVIKNDFGSNRLEGMIRTKHDGKELVVFEIGHHTDKDSSVDNVGGISFHFNHVGVIAVVPTSDLSDTVGY